MRSPSSDASRPSLQSMDGPLDLHAGPRPGRDGPLAGCNFAYSPLNIGLTQEVKEFTVNPGTSEQMANGSLEYASRR